MRVQGVQAGRAAWTESTKTEPPGPLLYPRCPTLLYPPLRQVRVTLPHLDALFYDDPVWDLGEQRSVCSVHDALLCWAKADMGRGGLTKGPTDSPCSTFGPGVGFFGRQQATERESN